MNTDEMEEENLNTEETVASAENDAEVSAAQSAADDATDATTADAETQPDDAKSPPEEKPSEPDWKDRFARLLAEFDNFRKRTEREREDLVKFAARDVVKDILSTVDNLARALEGAKDKADDPFVQGVKLVYDGLLKALADHGATPLDSLGEPFDVNYHEALAQMPSPDVEEGIVMNEVTRGWLLNGKLLRAAKVVVSAGKGE